MAWIENGPVSLPPRSVMALAGTAILVVALVGGLFGFSAGWRGGAETTRGSIDQNQDIDQATDAKPLVTLIEPTAPPPTNAPAANTAQAKNDSDDDDDSNEIAAKTAAVQAVQSKPSEAAPDIDHLLASPNEKPEAPAKPTTDEQAPPSKTDVPF